MNRLRWFTFVIFAGLVAAGFWLLQRFDFVVVPYEAEKKPYVFYTDPDALDFILSFQNIQRPMSRIDRLIFTRAGLVFIDSGRLDAVDIRRILEEELPASVLPFDLYTMPKTSALLPVTTAAKLPESGFDIGREGAVIKLVIPSSNRLLGVVELGVEPDQTEDLEKINLTPKARFQIVIPFN